MFNVTDAVEDIPQVLALFTAVEKQFATKPSTAVGWVTALGFLPGSLVMSGAQIFDEIHDHTLGPVTLDMIVKLLGVDANGVVGQALNLVAQIEAQVASGAAPSAPATPSASAPKPVPPVPAPKPSPTASGQGPGVGGGKLAT